MIAKRPSGVAAHWFLGRHVSGMGVGDFLRWRYPRCRRRLRPDSDGKEHRFPVGGRADSVNAVANLDVPHHFQRAKVDHRHIVAEAVRDVEPPHHSLGSRGALPAPIAASALNPIAAPTCDDRSHSDAHVTPPDVNFVPVYTMRRSAWYTTSTTTAPITATKIL